MSELRLTSVAGPTGTALGEWLERRVHRRSSWPALVRPPDQTVVAAEGAEPPGAEAIPAGPARPEALAVLAGRHGLSPGWTVPRTLPSARALLDVNLDRGRHSVAVVRADPSLLPELQVGAWTEAGWRTRLVRRAFAWSWLLPLMRVYASRAGAGGLGLLADVAFWAGVRARASHEEWRRWTRSYVALSYHRISADRKPGQELIEVTPQRFRAQLRMLRRLGFRPLSADDVDAVHHAGAQLPARRFVVTADDGFDDCTAPLLDGNVHAQLFVPTAQVGGIASAAWYDERPAAGWRVDDEPLADWDRLRMIEAGGVGVGGHSRNHVALTELSPGVLAAELQDSLDDLRRELHRPVTAMAYPHGLHDSAVRLAAKAAGYRIAYTTQFGRNGVGTDPWCLRRVPVFRDDGLPTVWWKVVTGEPLPGALAAFAGRAGSLLRIMRHPSRASLEESAAGRRMMARIAGTDERLVLAVLDALQAAGVGSCLAGGWGLDALAGRRTRRHGDLDVVVPRTATEQDVAVALARIGFRLREQHNAEGVAFDRRWVFGDRRGRRVDVLPVAEPGVFDLAAQATGRVGERTVACLSVNAQRAARTGFDWRSEDHAAMRLLDELGAG